MKLKFSTAFYSQRLEKRSVWMESWSLVGADQRDWVEFVGRTEFSRNVVMHLAKKGSSFVVAYGLRSNLLT